VNHDVLYLVDANTLQFSEGESPTGWVHALPVGEYSHPVFGKLSMTADKIKGFADNIVAKVRGIDPSINIIHGIPGTAGDGEAAGWVKSAEARPDGLWVLVEWTKAAADKIREKAWRYFSAEYQDTWTDATGKEHKNVFFGGALTNRPYMKNLLPINLSENTIETALELASVVAQGKAAFEKSPQEGDMDLKTLCERLGLPDGTTEEQLLAKLAELAAPTNKPAPKKAPEVPVVNLSEELKKLSEANPIVKTLIETVDAQNKALSDFNNQLREADVDRRLAEFDRSQIVLTPVAKDLVHDFALDLPVALTERFWEIMEKMRTSSSLMVELGERAGTSVRYGRSKDATSLFMDEANRIASEQKISLTEAMEQTARNNAALYDQYRSDTYAFKE
jgi:phage I-like protein